MAAVSTGLDLDALAELLRARTGFRLPAARRADLAAAARRVLARRPLRGRDPMEALALDPDSFDALVSEVTIGETYFFRDAGQLDLLRDRLLPALRSARGPGHALRFWSAGCASGEEAYSLAALLLEADAGPFHVLGTDICLRSLDRARRGEYGIWSLRGEGRPRMAPFLRQAGSRWRVSAPLREHVEFRAHNLATPGADWTGMRGMDVILCRNVMIYFGADTVGEVAARLHDALAPGGILLAGPSDPLLGDFAPFDVEATPSGAFYRRSGGERRAGIAPPPAPAPERVAVSTVAPPPRARVATRRRPAAAHPRTSAAVPDAAASGDPQEARYRQAMQCLADRDAVGAEILLRRMLYEDRDQPVVHFGLGVAMLALGRADAARRAFRNAAALASAGAARQLVRFGDGVTAAELARAAQAHMASLAAKGG